MENYQMGRSCGRPYRTTCGMNRMPASERMPMPERMPARTSGQNECERKNSCSCHLPGTTSKEAAIYAKADQLPLTMAYVPCQRFSDTFDLCRSLQMGTIFPELCKPFCGKRGMCR